MSQAFCGPDRPQRNETYKNISYVVPCEWLDQHTSARHEMQL